MIRRPAPTGWPPFRAGTAWATIDNGDVLDLLQPGDTVNILPGTYAINSKIVLVGAGSADNPIVYRRLGASPIVVDEGSLSDLILSIEGNHTFSAFHSMLSPCRLIPPCDTPSSATIAWDMRPIPAVSPGVWRRRSGLSMPPDSSTPRWSGPLKWLLSLTCVAFRPNPDTGFGANRPTCRIAFS